MFVQTILQVLQSLPNLTWLDGIISCCLVEELSCALPSMKRVHIRLRCSNHFDLIGQRFPHLVALTLECERFGLEADSDYIVDPDVIEVEPEMTCTMSLPHLSALSLTCRTFSFDVRRFFLLFPNIIELNLQTSCTSEFLVSECIALRDVLPSSVKFLTLNDPNVSGVNLLLQDIELTMLRILGLSLDWRSFDPDCDDDANLSFQAFKSQFNPRSKPENLYVGGSVIRDPFLRRAFLTV